MILQEVVIGTAGDNFTKVTKVMWKPMPSTQMSTAGNTAGSNGTKFSDPATPGSAILSLKTLHL